MDQFNPHHQRQQPWLQQQQHHPHGGGGQYLQPPPPLEPWNAQQSVSQAWSGPQQQQQHWQQQAFGAQHGQEADWAAKARAWAEANAAAVQQQQHFQPNAGPYPPALPMQVPVPEQAGQPQPSSQLYGPGRVEESFQSQPQGRSSAAPLSQLPPALQLAQSVPAQQADQAMKVLYSPPHLEGNRDFQVHEQQLRVDASSHQQSAGVPAVPSPPPPPGDTSHPPHPSSSSQHPGFHHQEQPQPPPQRQGHQPLAEGSFPQWDHQQGGGNQQYANQHHGGQVPGGSHGGHFGEPMQGFNQAGMSGNMGMQYSQGIAGMQHQEAQYPSHMHNQGVQFSPGVFDPRMGPAPGGVPPYGFGGGMGAMSAFEEDPGLFGDRPRKAGIPSWLREELMKKQQKLATEGPAQGNGQAEASQVEEMKAPEVRRARSTSASSSEDSDEEGAAAAARVAAMNQEIKRVLTEVLLKVTEELFVEIAKEVYYEEEGAVSKLPAPKPSLMEKEALVSPKPAAAPAPLAAPARAPLPAPAPKPATKEESESDDDESKGAPGNLLGLANYDESDEEDQGGKRAMRSVDHSSRNGIQGSGPDRSGVAGSGRAEGSGRHATGEAEQKAKAEGHSSKSGDGVRRERSAEKGSDSGTVSSEWSGEVRARVKRREQEERKRKKHSRGSSEESREKRDSKWLDKEKEAKRGKEKAREKEKVTEKESRQDKEKERRGKDERGRRRYGSRSPPARRKHVSRSTSRSSSPSRKSRSRSRSRDRHSRRYRSRSPHKRHKSRSRSPAPKRDRRRERHDRHRRRSPSPVKQRHRS